MDEDHDRMYVGTKDYILSLDLHDINKEPLIVRNVPETQTKWKGAAYVCSLTTLGFFFPCQIHWPVASQRKTECILSGKDTNVSNLI